MIHTSLNSAFEIPVFRNIDPEVLNKRLHLELAEDVEIIKINNPSLRQRAKGIKFIITIVIGTAGASIEDDNIIIEEKAFDTYVQNAFFLGQIVQQTIAELI
jgi:hypothetical protein